MAWTDLRTAWHCCTALACLLAGTALHAQTIYSCVDAKGNRITSDRPIMECLDREQQKYGPTGTRRGTLSPSLTGPEQVAAEEKARKDAEDKARAAEQRQRDKVLSGRYPDEAAHRRERQISVGPVDDAIAAGEQRIVDLQKQRITLEADARAAPASDTAKAGRARRLVTENEEDQAATRRMVAGKQEERQRITKRFDEELARLRVVWAQQAAIKSATASAANAANPAKPEPPAPAKPAAAAVSKPAAASAPKPAAASASKPKA